MIATIFSLLLNIFKNVGAHLCVRPNVATIKSYFNLHNMGGHIGPPLQTYLIILIFIITSSAALANNAQANFQDGLNYAKSPGIKNTLQKALTDFKPQEALKSKKVEYTDNPPQINYYNEEQSKIFELEKNSREEVTKDEEDNVGKVVTTAYTTRPMVKITGKEEFMQKGKLVTENANNIVMGESNKHINCDANTMATCKIIQVEKTCNEAKPIRKVCEQKPKIDVSTQDVVYSNCKKFVVTQDLNVHCPGGYQQILYSDMVLGVTWDDIRICQKAVSNEENAECLGGYLVRGIDGGRSIIQSTERVVVPKNMRSR